MEQDDDQADGYFSSTKFGWGMYLMTLVVDLSSSPGFDRKSKEAVLKIIFALAAYLGDEEWRALNLSYSGIVDDEKVLTELKTVYGMFAENGIDAARNVSKLLGDIENIAKQEKR